jgi:endonuclease YncB( thermonuclease family)
MKTFLLTLCLICGISSLSYSEDFTNVRYIKNYDGDTLIVDIPGVPDIFGKNISVRVYGIDTPEMKGKCDKEKQLARESQLLVEKLLTDSSKVVIKNAQRDKYFRILGEVYADGISISEVLKLKGYAVPYFGDTKTKDWCK